MSASLRKRPKCCVAAKRRYVPRAVVSRCSNVKPKLLDYLVGNGLMLHGFADTAAFDATLVNLGFGPQLRPQQVRPRAARLVLCLRYLFGAVRRPSPRSLRGPSSLTANGMDRLLSVDYPFAENPPGTKWLESASRGLKPLDRLA